MKSELAFVLENANWPALLVDQASTILRANPAAVRAFGLTLEGASPLLAAVWSPENGVTAEQFLSQWERAPSATMPLKYRVKGGTVATYSTALCALTKDREKYFILQMLPESARSPDPKAASAEAGAHKQKLDCALQLARSVALDFNNALTSILGYTSLILSKVEPDHPWRRALLEVEKAAGKAAEIANDLAGFSRQERDTRSQNSGNLNAVLRRCVETLQNSSARTVQWRLHLERRLFTVRFDEAKMQQAFLKILENAVEALRTEGNITIHTRNVELAEAGHDRNLKLAAGTYVCAEITDNGGGIAPELLSRIFEPFFTTKPPPHRGLGLAWVYGIVTNHGGGVAVSSEPGAGAAVRVYLPAESAIVRDNTEFIHNLTGSQTILLVDDEELLLTMGETILSGYGYTVLTANSGRAALDLLARTDKPVDLLITDLVMPLMSGRELVEHVGQNSPATRVLCMSGYASPARHNEEATYLQKPFTSQELLMKVKEVLTSSTTVID